MIPMGLQVYWLPSSRSLFVCSFACSFWFVCSGLYLFVRSLFALSFVYYFGLDKSKHKQNTKKNVFFSGYIQNRPPLHYHKDRLKGASDSFQTLPIQNKMLRFAHTFFLWSLPYQGVEARETNVVFFKCPPSSGTQIEEKNEPSEITTRISG